MLELIIQIIQTIHRHLDVKHNTYYGLQAFQLNNNMDQFLLSLAPNVDLKMCGSKTNSFQFGDAAKFQPELNSVAAKVQRQETELSALQVFLSSSILIHLRIWWNNQNCSVQRSLDLVESKMSLNCGGSLLGARYDTGLELVLLQGARYAAVIFSLGSFMGAAYMGLEWSFS